jgi:CheY-like chemotaxis protein
MDLPAGRRIGRILVAEPDDDTRMLYETVLRPLSADVVGVADGRQALVSALTHPPSIVVTETDLSLIDGYALCELLRKDATTRHAPILVATAETQASQIGRVRRAGADAVLVKPFSPEVLVAEVLRLCDPASRKWRDKLDSIQPRQAPAKRSRSHERYETIMPPIAPPQIRCRRCDRDIQYERSHIGGVNSAHAEQWDTFTCKRCGARFEYRHRTRKLRQVG